MQAGSQAQSSQHDGQLFVSLYDELHRIAQREARRNTGAGCLSATTILHEAWLSLSRRDPAAFTRRADFIAYAARAMRGLIIDYARRRRALKRGGAFELTSLPDEVPEHVADVGELDRLSAAIDLLASVEPRLAQVVDLKYFGGFSFTEIAAMWGLSERTVQRDWEKARVLLHRSMTADSIGCQGPLD